MGVMRRKMRTRFWVESVLAATAGALFVLTLFWQDWLEALGFDPDNHDGTVEWLIVVGILIVCIVFALLARLEWRKSALAR